MTSPFSCIPLASLIPRLWVSKYLCAHTVEWRLAPSGGLHLWNRSCNCVWEGLVYGTVYATTLQATRQDIEGAGCASEECASDSAEAKYRPTQWKTDLSHTHTQPHTTHQSESLVTSTHNLCLFHVICSYVLHEDHRTNHTYSWEQNLV